MLNLKQQLTKAWKYFAGGATVLAYQEWIERIQNKDRLLEQNKTIQDIKTAVLEVKEDIKSIVDENIKNNLTHTANKMNDDLNTIKAFHRKIDSLSDELFKDNNLTGEQKSEIVENLNHWNKEIGSVIERNLSRSEELTNFIRDLGNKSNFFEDSSISKIISEFKVYLSTLSVYELCILMDLLVSMFIFGCLISILFAFYGNYLIEKFNLETKYPKLSGFIKLRAKLQHYYIFINSLAIIIALFFISYINFYTLIYS